VIGAHADRSTVAGAEERGDESYRCVLPGGAGGLLVGDGGGSLKNGRRRRRRGGVRSDVFLPGGQASPSLLSVGHDVTAAPVQATDGTAAAAERTRRSRGEVAVDRWSCGGGHADCGWFSLVRAICQRRWLDFGSISRSGWKRGEEAANSDFGIGGGSEF